MKPLYAIALDWALRSFGHEQMNNPGLRALRVGEEAVELMQACRVPQETAELMVRTVYSRPRGAIPQEIGGVLMTINLFVAGLGQLFEGCEPEHYFVKELRRVLGKPAKHFTDRNAEKVRLGLDVIDKHNAAVADAIRTPTKSDCPTCGGDCGQCGGGSHNTYSGG